MALSRLFARLFPKRPSPDALPYGYVAAPDSWRLAPSIAALPVHTVLHHEGELITQIRSLVTRDEDFFAYYEPLMKALAGYIHLVPASKDHHHWMAGGLLRHCLEVGLYAIRESKATIYHYDAFAAHLKSPTDERWQFTCFAAGLLHDIGKTLTDMVVTGDKGLTWEPVLGGLDDWLRDNGVSDYRVEWLDGRVHNAHNSVNMLVGSRLISPQSLRYMNELGLGMMEDFSAALAQKQTSSMLEDVLIKADSRSTSESTRTHGAKPDAPTDGLSRYIALGMEALFDEERAKANCPGSWLWVMDGQVFMVWPRLAMLLVDRLRQKELPGVPRSEMAIRLLLVDRGFIEAAEDESVADQHEWKIAPAALQKPAKEIVLTAVVARNGARFFPSLPADAPGRVWRKTDPAPGAAADADDTPPEPTAPTGSDPATSDEPPKAPLTLGDPAPGPVEKPAAAPSTKPPRPPKPPSPAAKRQLSIDFDDADADSDSLAAMTAEDAASFVAESPLHVELNALIQRFRRRETKGRVGLQGDQLICQYPAFLNGLGSTEADLAHELLEAGHLAAERSSGIDRAVHRHYGGEDIYVLIWTAQSTQALLMASETADLPAWNTPEDPATPSAGPGSQAEAALKTLVLAVATSEGMERVTRKGRIHVKAKELRDGLQSKMNGAGYREISDQLKEVLGMTYRKHDSGHWYELPRDLFPSLYATGHSAPAPDPE